MAAPKDNQYALGCETSGRPHAFIKITHERLRMLIDNYFNATDRNPIIVQDFIKSGQTAGQIVKLEKPRPYSVEGLCIAISCSVKTFYNWINSEKDKEYLQHLVYARDRIKQQHMELGISGDYNSNLVAKYHQMKDNVDITSDGGKVEGIGAIVFKTAKEGE